MRIDIELERAINKILAEENEWLSTRPVCAKCGEPITEDELYDIAGTIYCEECMNFLFRKESDEYAAI